MSTTVMLRVDEMSTDSIPRENTPNNCARKVIHSRDEK
jgi:hypothetical protein